MILKYLLLLYSFFPLFASTAVEANKNKDYFQYHKQIRNAETQISEKNFKDALDQYERVFGTYDFIFLRDYQVATQLALHLDQNQKAIHYLKEGIAAGWELKAIKANQYLKPLRDGPEWKMIKKSFAERRKKYEAKLNQQVRDRVRKMFKKDQWKAIGALFRIGDKAQERYAERKFAPHSESQMVKLIEILEKHGYPGERLIGNDFWVSTIISHHNSISQKYAQKDTLYDFIKPKLIESIKNGQMSPYEYALIDDWYKTVVSDRTEVGYGFLNSPNRSTLSEINILRQRIGLRSIELRNKLVEVEKKQV